MTGLGPGTGPRPPLPLAVGPDGASDLFLAPRRAQSPSCLGQLPLIAGASSAGGMRQGTAAGGVAGAASRLGAHSSTAGQPQPGEAQTSVVPPTVVDTGGAPPVPQDLATPGNQAAAPGGASATAPPNGQLQLHLRGTALGFFGPSNPLRIAAARLVAHRHFDNAVLVLILLSSVALALDAPGLDPGGCLKVALHGADIAFTVLFAAEAAAKAAAAGLVANGPGSYLRNPWNVLDFAVVLIGRCLGWGHMATWWGSGYQGGSPLECGDAYLARGRRQPPVKDHVHRRGTQANTKASTHFTTRPLPQGS